jgi:hypothetical protein
MAIDGESSDFPERLDDWGEAFKNNQCPPERFRASRMNALHDALYNLEQHTRRVLITGDTNLRTDTGADRPKLMVKTFVVTVTGGDAETKTANLEAFTTAELAFWDGNPLAATHNVHLYVRKIRVDNTEKQSYVAGLASPVVASGSGQTITLAPLRDTTGETNLKIGNGDYIVTLLITR